MRQENTRAAAESGIIEEVFTKCGETVFAAMAGLFAQRSTRMSARYHLTGLTAELPRENRWILAEHAGHASPGRLQYLLEREIWGERVLRGIVAAQVVDALGADGEGPWRFRTLRR